MNIEKRKIKKITSPKLDEALQRAQEFIEQMEKMDDKKLSKHLDLFRQQMEMAYQQNNDAAFRLLVEYEFQTITARVNKNCPFKK